MLCDVIQQLTLGQSLCVEVLFPWCHYIIILPSQTYLPYVYRWPFESCRKLDCKGVSSVCCARLSWEFVVSITVKMSWLILPGDTPNFLSSVNGQKVVRRKGELDVLYIYCYIWNCLALENVDNKEISVTK